MLHPHSLTLPSWVIYMYICVCVIKSAHDATCLCFFLFLPRRLSNHFGPFAHLYLNPSTSRSTKNYFARCPFCRFSASDSPQPPDRLGFLLPTQILTCQIEPLLTLLGGARCGDIHVSNQSRNEPPDDGNTP